MLDDGSNRRKHVGNNVCAITDIGRRRTGNEDAFQVSPDGQMMIVADGMGGHASGELASTLSIQLFDQFFSEKRKSDIAGGSGSVIPLLTQAFHYVNQRIYEESERRRLDKGMGAALITGYILEGMLYLCHVGDVRGYLSNRGTFEQVTQDHSVVAQMVREGELTPEQGKQSTRRNELLQAIGIWPQINPEVNYRSLFPGDYVLLCSDGLWGVVSDHRMWEIVEASLTIEEAAMDLVTAANEAGGPDNITVALYKYVG